jgi:holo-[acyl-carrier protein] synthase
LQQDGRAAAVLRGAVCGEGSHLQGIWNRYWRKASGEPFVVLHGEGAKTAVRLGITEIRLSLSHSDQYAVAHALALGV